MTANCALYVPVDFFPSASQLEPHCPDAWLDVKAFDEQAVVTWKGLSVTMTRMPRSAVAEHLQGFVGYVKANGGSPALETRILHSRSVYGCVIEPDFDDEGRVMRFLGGITDAADGLAFIDGEVFGPGGRQLLLGGEPLTPPSAARVVARAQVLLSLAIRGLLEEDLGKPDQPKAEALRQTLCDWAEERLSAEIEPEERAFLAGPLGTVPKQLVIDAVWRAEGAQVLLWALGARGLPAPDAQEHPYEVADQSGVMTPLPAVLAHPTLRPLEEVEALRKQLMGVHWRLREQGVRPGPLDFARFAKSAWFGEFNLEGVPLSEDDVSLGGRPVSKAEAAALKHASSIAHERHLAANWLIGVHETYSAVNTPT